ncbi:MAG: hypothetical protein DHS20C15_08880 [Planctomycetota bacterium]|nr:MAG: hypothetical protein DHS20C15_08880 [Planctomycetota bacterium]
MLPATTPPPPARSRSTWIAVALLLLGHALLAAAGGPRSEPFGSLLAWSLAGAGWTIAVRAVLRGQPLPSLRVLLLVALVARLIAFTGDPSDDLARYVWEGRVQRAGFDPYRLPPHAGELAALAARAPEFAQINHPEWTAIYPPLTQLVQRTLVGIAPNAWSFRIAFLLAEAALVGLLIGELRRRGQPPQRVLIYAWSPLAIFATAHEVHSDVLAALLLFAALATLVRQRHTLAGALASCAVFAKFLPLVAAPALLTEASRASPRRPRSLVLFGAGALLAGAVLLWPFRHSGSALLSSFSRFGAELHFNDALPSLLRGAFGLQATPWISAALGLAAAGWIWARTPPDAFLRAALLLAVMLLLLPTLHPWYLMLLLPFLVLFPWWGWLAFTLTSALTWLALLELRRSGQWVEWPWLRLPEYAPLALWLSWRAARILSRRRVSTRSAP